MYFTDPSLESLESFRGGPDAHLVEAIGQARVSVDMAAYDLNLWSVRDALIDAHRRGVTVRLVIEGDNKDNLEMDQIKNAGILVLDDRRDGLMHNKFIVIDRQEVWAGSMNFTINGAYRHNNNLIRIRDSQVADTYLIEFNEMFVDDQFGFTSPANTPEHQLLVDENLVEVYFSPDDGVARRLLRLIREAEESIYFMAFSFTSDDLAQAIIDRNNDGLTVIGVMDESQVRSNTGGEFENLLAAGVNVSLDGNSDKLHHKVIVIDSKIVITGSYNFSKNAETLNDENVLIIHSPEVAAWYLDEFERVYKVAQR